MLTNQQFTCLVETYIDTVFRLPICLYYYRQYSTAEIAQLLKIPRGTVCTSLSRGRGALKLELQEGEDYE